MKKKSQTPKRKTLIITFNLVSKDEWPHEPGVEPWQWFSQLSKTDDQKFAESILAALNVALRAFGADLVVVQGHRRSSGTKTA
jgi:hypothetical protein